jgi:hypothetical protein
MFAFAFWNDCVFSRCEDSGKGAVSESYIRLSLCNISYVADEGVGQIFRRRNNPQRTASQKDGASWFTYCYLCNVVINSVQYRFEISRIAFGIRGKEYGVGAQVMCRTALHAFTDAGATRPCIRGKNFASPYDNYGRAWGCVAGAFGGNRRPIRNPYSALPHGTTCACSIV